MYSIYNKIRNGQHKNVTALFSFKFFVLVIMQHSQRH
jgi:hypothetical protein